MSCLEDKPILGILIPIFWFSRREGRELRLAVLYTEHTCVVILLYAL